MRAGSRRGLSKNQRAIVAAAAAGILALAPGRDARAGTVSLPFFTLDGRFTSLNPSHEFAVTNDRPATATAGSDLFSPNLTLFEGSTPLVIANDNPLSTTQSRLNAPAALQGQFNRLLLAPAQPPTIGQWQLDWKPVVNLQNPVPTFVQLAPGASAGSEIRQIRFGVDPVEVPNLPGNPQFARPHLFLNQFGVGLASSRIITQNASVLHVDADLVLGELSHTLTNPLYAQQSEIDVGGVLRVGALQTDSAYTGLIHGNQLVKIGAGTFTVADTNIKLQVDAGTLEFRPQADVFPDAIAGAATVRVASGYVHANALNLFTGTLVVTGTATASGRFPEVTRLEVQPGGRFRTLADSNVSLLNQSAQVILAGGTVELVGNASAAFDQIPAVTVDRGASTLHARSDLAAGSATLIVNGLAQRRAGATLDFTGTGPGGNGRIVINGQAPGFIGGWATAGGADFAKYDPTDGVLPFDPADYSTQPQPGVHFTSKQALSNIGTATPLTVRLEADLQPITVNQDNGTTLTVAQGGFLKVGPNAATIGGANLTSGSSDLIMNVHQGTLTVASRIVGTRVALTKAGPGDLILAAPVANTYTGPTFVNNGRMILDSQTTNGAIPGSVTLNGGTLRSLQSDQIGDAAAVTIGPGGRLNFVNVDESVRAIVNNGGQFFSGGGAITATDMIFGPGGTNRIQAPPPSPAPLPAAPLPAGPLPAAPFTGVTAVTALVVSGGDNVIENGATLTVRSGGLTFTGGASPALRLADTALLRLEGDVFVSCTGTATIGPTLAPPSTGGTIDLAAGERTIDVDPAGTLDVGSVITNGSLIKSGGGVLRLTKASTYAGGTLVTGGTVDASVPGAFGTGPVVFAGGSLAFNSAGSPALNYVMAVNADMTVTVDGASLASTNAGSVAMGDLTMSSSNVNLIGPGAAAVTFSGTASLTGTSTLVNTPAVTLTGPISQGEAGAGITKEGVGKLTIAGYLPNTYTGLTRVNDGTLELAKTGGATAVPGNLTIANGAVRLAEPNQIADGAAVNLLQATASLDFGTHSETVASLTVTNAAVTLGRTKETPSVLRTRALTLDGVGYVDLANNAMIVDYTGESPLAAIGRYVRNEHLRADAAVGYGEASRLFDLDEKHTAIWLGQTVDATSILVRNTLPGDATIDTVVDFNDLVKLAQNYNTAGDMSWVDGDFTGDSAVDFNDLVLLAQNYNSALPGAPIPGAATGFDQALAAAFATVPEPGAASILLACGLAGLARRRRSRRSA